MTLLPRLWGVRNMSSYDCRKTCLIGPSFFMAPRVLVIVISVERVAVDLRQQNWGSREDMAYI